MKNALKINWGIRVKNPLWWAQIVLAVVVPMLAYFGLNWQDMTTWESLGGVFLRAVQNPVVILGALVSAFNAITDPTTAGIGDSARALGYDEPYKDGGNA